MSPPVHCCRARPLLVATLALAAMAATACTAGGDGPVAAEAPGTSGDPIASGSPVTLRLGYFANLTHATAIVGLERGILREALGRDVLRTSTFNAGPAAVEAIFSGALDAAYIGPNPAINAFTRSGGEAIRIVSGATSGGASLVVKPEIRRAADLRGRKVASPQLGGTQDVALRHWLGRQGLETTPTGGGDVSVLPQENSQTLDTFKQGKIRAAWVPEPWATRLVSEGGGTVLVDEADLWPGGRFVTTHLVVRTEFLEEHPGPVRRLLEGQVRADELINTQPEEARRLVNRGLERITGKRLPDDVLEAAWENLSFTNDPIASSLATSASHAEQVGLLDETELDGIYDLRLLNDVLRAAGKKEITR